MRWVNAFPLPGVATRALLPVAKNSAMLLQPRRSEAILDGSFRFWNGVDTRTGVFRVLYAHLA